MERNLSPRRRAYDLTMRSLVWLCAGLTCALLLFLIGFIFYRGFPGVTWDFLSGTSSYIKDTIGILPNILNTLYIVLLAMTLVLPLGVGAAIYLTALSGSLLGLLVLAGYVLLVEDNQWLRLSAVKAVAVYLFFTFVIQAVGYVPDVLGIISDAGNLFSAYISVPVLNDIVTLVKDLIYLAEKIFLMVLGVKALNQGTVAVPFVDKLVVKYL